MYFNEEHNQRVINRGDNYTYIGSYKKNEETLDGKNKKGNANYIRVKCPYCGMEYDIQSQHFKRGDKCSHCCNCYEKSFAYYIQQELREPLNKYWNWEKNTVNPYYISKAGKVEIYLKCQKKDYHNDDGGYLTTCDIFYRGIRCPYCNNKRVHPKDSFAQWGIDTFGNDFLDKYWSNKNTLNPWKLAPRSGEKVWIYCQEKEYHNDEGGYPITPTNFYKGQRCGYCHHLKIHPKDSFGALYPSKAKHWSENNDKSPFEVAPKSNDEYKFICEKCGEEFERVLFHLNQRETGVVCKKCRGSELEQKTKIILEKYNIKYKREASFKNLVGKGNSPLRFDFYLPDYNIMIECQGIQHEIWMEGWITKKDFERQLKHDKRKRKYAKQHNIKLLEIWYNEIDNIEDILIKELNLEYRN